MNFYDQIKQQTTGNKAAFYSLAILQDALKANISIGLYIDFLTQAYHHVKHTVPLLMACGARLSQQQEWLREAMAEYIEEELGHQEWILNDIDAAGGDASKVRAGMPGLHTDLMVAYAYDTIARKNPDSHKTFSNKATPQVTSSPFEGGENYEHKLAFQIWNNQGALLLRSENAPLEAMASEHGKLLTTTIFDNIVRTLAIPSPDCKLIAQNLEIKREATIDILELLVYVLILSFPILMWLINRSINQGTQSLNSLSEKIARRTEHDLALIETDDIPQEIQGIVNALNKLMSRVNAALGRERQFISDAAHELRTPLSGIKAHAQLAIKDESRRLSSLTRIVGGVDRTTRLANQLLTLSGVDAINKLDAVQAVDLNELIHTVVDDLSTGIKEKSLELVNNSTCSQSLNGNEDLLYILIRNLIDNVIRYTPENTEITLDCRKIDQGPGIATEHRQRVFDRFYRDLENSSNGSGLGLAIAEKIARLHNAKIELEPGDNHQGLIAKVKFKL